MYTFSSAGDYGIPKSVQGVLTQLPKEPVEPGLRIHGQVGRTAEVRGHGDVVLRNPRQSFFFGRGRAVRQNDLKEPPKLPHDMRR